ncbi:DNA repair protein SMC6 [Lachancea thermotolerans CBS 6340]|uniref:KLTH0D14080p n=1 Tax=Lachancea thermotolerans (strain ATCC 56472 / CBS 6340 / NRRL Y-8284) TaxID=559295 RepID=C5DFC8_LACTC|nr:KLTH0D14080p [Lachancea thermotolerans CBS 6340]CAR22883.1 KLTH0D14080p [Lachancea thermotolerans CBS 6340]
MDINDNLVSASLVAMTGNVATAIGSSAILHDGEQRPSKRQRRFAPMTQHDSQTGAAGSEGANLNPPGFIKRVQLRNFMCHEHFELELGPRLNFIVGNNGSGKSAVLTAITIGLGAKAADTNRGSSLKDLIREGCNSSKIVVVLNNEGFGGYEQGTYGTEIRIERTIKKSGPAGFSLKSETGKEISNKKRDLQAIVDYFAVPVMNPMCFLSQDAARSFLTATTPADKYKHFMRGTLLEDTETNLKKALEIATTAQSNLNYHAENVKLLRQDYDHTKKLLKELTANHDLTDRKRALQGKLLWLSVVENETSQRKLEVAEAHYLAKIKESEGKSASRTNSKEQLKLDQAAAEQQLEEALSSWQTKKRLADEAQSLMHSARMEYNMQKEHREETQKHINDAEGKVRQFENTIKDFEERLEKQMGGDKKRMHEEIEDLKERIKTQNEFYSSMNIRLQELRNKEEMVTSNALPKIGSLQKSIHEKTEQIRDIAQGKRNFLSNFDPHMEKLVRLIEQRKSEFSSKPVGPLGNYVTVKSQFQEWARPIQRYLGGTLSAFVVANVSDGALLKSLIRACQIRSNINVITYKLNEFDFDSGKARSEYPSVADALEFKSRSLQCLFVDQNRIEKVVLVTNKSDARDVLKRHNKNVIMTLSLRDNRSGYQSSLSAHGGFRIDTIEYQDKMKLTTKVSDTAFLTEIVSEEKKELANLTSQRNDHLKKIGTEITTLREEMANTKSKISEFSKREAALRLDLERELDTSAIEQAESDKQVYVNALASYNLALDEVNEKIDIIRQKVQPLKVRYEQANNELNSAACALDDLKHIISKGSSRIEKLQDDIGFSEKKVEKYQQKRTELLQKINEFSDGIGTQISNAETYCTRAVAFAGDMPETREDTKAEIDRITHRIQLAENRVGLSQDQIMSLFESAKLKYKDAEQKFANVDKAVFQLNESLKRRWQSLTYAKTDTCVTADTDFKESLRFRNFSGGLNFNFSKETLNMLVKTPNDEKPRNVDTFSGGEKSFSQISLLLATWRPMRSRIIALDEFDVFMDQVNRQIGTKLIMNKLSKESRTQTVIITPQDIGKIANFEDPGIRIHRMKDPERLNNSSYYA